MNAKGIAIGLMAVVLSACASTGDNNKRVASDDADDVYVTTGSMIPKKKTDTSNVQTVDGDQAADSIRNAAGGAGTKR